MWTSRSLDWQSNVTSPVAVKRAVARDLTASRFGHCGIRCEKRIADRNARYVHESIEDERTRVGPVPQQCSAVKVNGGERFVCDYGGAEYRAVVDVDDAVTHRFDGLAMNL